MDTQKADGPVPRAGIRDTIIPSGYTPSGYQMIKEIGIQNFKCFERVQMDKCRRINILVGDNGAGKTAFLEAIFLALAGNAQVVIRARQARGLDGLFSGIPRVIEDALWGDLFYNFDIKNTVSVSLSGTGSETRSVSISKGLSNTLVPLENINAGKSTASFNFIWRNNNGQEFDGSPSFTGTTLTFPPEQEHLPDYFYFSSTQIGSAGENAGRFSELSKARRQREFVDLFVKEYPWIEDLSIEVVAGQPVIHATLRDLKEKIPLNSISSGINRLLSILLVMASHPGSVVLVDEIENGLYYKHQESFWRWLLSFSSATDGQLFLTTHSEEWLRALVAVADADTIRQVAFWRIERGEKGKPEIFSFAGDDLKAGIEYGAELRGGTE
jgi:hypothetical protein